MRLSILGSLEAAGWREGPSGDHGWLRRGRALERTEPRERSLGRVSGEAGVVDVAAAAASSPVPLCLREGRSGSRVALEPARGSGWAGGASERAAVVVVWEGAASPHLTSGCSAGGERRRAAAAAARLGLRAGIIGG